MNFGEPFVGTVFQALLWPSDIIYLIFDEAAASVHHFQILFLLTLLLRYNSNKVTVPLLSVICYSFITTNHTEFPSVVSREGQFV